jgi:NCS1 nucleoside transporter family
MSRDSSDIEKQPHESVAVIDQVSHDAGRQLTTFDGWFSGLPVLAAMRRAETKLDKKFGVESHGPDRVLPEARTNPPSLWVMFALWGSCTMNLSCFATGFLGWEFGLNLKQSILCVIFGTVLGSSVTGWCATLGPASGLRQISISRYSLGWWPTKVIAVVNAIEQLGWAAAGCITGGLALNAVSDGNVSLIVGEVIIGVVGVVLSFIGLRCVLKYEQFAWMIFLVIFLVMFGEVGPKTNASDTSSLSGATLGGTVLSLIAIVYGSSASWCTVVSDYYVQFPANTSKHKIFWYTTLGIMIPTCIGMLLGCVAGAAIDLNKGWSDQYEMGLGYYIQTFMYPLGFAKFVLVLLVLSGIGMNCVSVYSSALSMQQVSRELQAMPRIIWTVLIFIVIMALSIAGRDQLLPYLENFLSLLYVLHSPPRL